MSFTWPPVPWQNQSTRFSTNLILNLFSSMRMSIFWGTSTNQVLSGNFLRLLCQLSPSLQRDQPDWLGHQADHQDGQADLRLQQGVPRGSGGLQGNWAKPPARCRCSRVAALSWWSFALSSTLTQSKMLGRLVSHSHTNQVYASSSPDPRKFR